MRSNPYPVPRNWLWQIGATTVYLLVAGSGMIVAAYCIYGPVQNAIHMGVLIAWAVGTVIPGLACAYGAFAYKYRWEWVASWPLAGGIGIYATFSWLTLPSIWGLPNAMLLTALMIFFAGRGLKLSVYDRNVRQDALRKVLDGVTDG